MNIKFDLNKFFINLSLLVVPLYIMSAQENINKEKEKILVIYGTNRKHSLTEQVADYYVKLLKGHKAIVDVIKLIELPEDFTVSALYDNNGKNAKFNLFRDKINRFKKIVIITPEYNGSIPGVLKHL